VPSGNDEGISIGGGGGGGSVVGGNIVTLRLFTVGAGVGRPSVASCALCDGRMIRLVPLDLIMK
jgi:hypothetical protein